MSLEIDRQKIATPQPQVSKEAFSQLQLILANDWTHKGKGIRISIAGKGCHGFDYALGFDHEKEGDFKYLLDDLIFLFDPFCAFYAQKLRIDYKLDLQNNRDGFVIKSCKENTFAGKFWRQHQELTPRLKDSSSSL